MKYNKKFNQIIEKLSSLDNSGNQSIKEEITTLVNLYKKKDERLNKIIKLSDKQQMAILELHEELDSYKKHLEKKVEEEIQKRIAQEELLFEQSRLAAIAEMIDAVAHQWTQPLNILSMQIDILKLEANENNGVSPQIINRFKKDTFLQIRHLIDTLKNFRQFFTPIKEAKPFSVKNEIDSVLKLIKDEMIKYVIDIEVHADKDFRIIGNANEFKHIILNLISNTKYAFLKNNTKNRKITIKILGKERKLEFIDNAGGIPSNIIDRIFDIRVTTKGEEGTGIGLYMSAQIAKKHHGELLVENLPNGAKFTFELKD